MSKAKKSKRKVVPIPKNPCIEIVRPKSAFVPESFRYVVMPKAIIMIGCPKGKGHWKTGVKTLTNREGVKQTVRGFCSVGTRAHAKIQRSTGSCRVGYRRKAKRS